MFYIYSAGEPLDIRPPRRVDAGIDSTEPDNHLHVTIDAGSIAGSGVDAENRALMLSSQDAGHVQN